jgi:hypothetical protein
MQEASKLSKWGLNQYVGALTIVAFITSLCNAAGLGAQLDNSMMMRVMSHMIPAIDLIAAQTHSQVTARVTIAVQWLFLPAYFAYLCSYRPPWEIRRPRDEALKADLRSRAKMTLPFTVIIGWAIFADWNIVGGPSFFRGTVWESSFPLTQLPYTGSIGLAISAFLSPLFESLIYWLVLVTIAHYFIPAFLQVKDQQD